jgi:hypothetical protein
MISRLCGIGLAASTLLLTGCLTDPELVREQRRQEQLRIQTMMENGECSVSQRTGSRTRRHIECGDENDDRTDAARESMRRINRQGGICGGDNEACNPM